LEVFLAAFVPSVDLAGALEAVAGALPAVEAGLGAIATEDEVIGRDEDNGRLAKWKGGSLTDAFGLYTNASRCTCLGNTTSLIVIHGCHMTFSV